MKVEWLHSFDDEPVEVYSEVGDDGYETRKVELFPDGRLEYADGHRETGATGLSEVPVGTVAGIAAQEEFQPHVISRREFEEMWARAVAARGE
ncbi:hypothetical protein GCM10009678_47580 [Actinomadura kijaniata]|uniref:DUF6881 domain-containing protein n=1 Tax=Actinomadura namibiensis TaxID=182080 RepID=A0A7W3QKG4_ACTNM|nr:hypothetical protein [Actinomadura namibiensis]MBA8949933.1 hypothetical protein [Actinomadura namibiensis]